jgi:hypothetical protein
MAYYGNILTILNSSAAVLQIVTGILDERKVRYELVESTFFLETSSMTNTTNVNDDLTNAQVDFIFSHIHLSDGSEVWANGVDQLVIDRIEDILL